MNIQKMMKQMQRMQADMARAQEDLAGRTIDVSGPGGHVTITISGAQEITGIKINKAVVDPSDVEMLESMILKTIQEALAKSKEMAAGEMGKLTQGMGLPPGMGF